MIFSAKAYEIVRRIPKGKVLTYKKVVELAGNPLVFRAVENILNKNYDPSLIHCHGSIRLDGRIGGYNRGQKEKIRLLRE